MSALGILAFRRRGLTEMKPNLWILSLIGALVLGCLVGAGAVLYLGSPERAQVEGVIFSVEFQQGSGTGGFTRLNNSKAVPGGNGSWNVDAYGKLYRDFLVISFPDKKDLGPQVIPLGRLLSVQFGDGGIKEMPKTAAP